MRIDIHAFPVGTCQNTIGKGFLSNDFTLLGRVFHGHGPVLLVFHIFIDFPLTEKATAPRAYCPEQQGQSLYGSDLGFLPFTRFAHFGRLFRVFGI